METPAKVVKKESSQSGWNVKEALLVLRATTDPSIWEQGQELYRRGAVEDFQVTAAGDIQVRVLDPRDLRKFAVSVVRDHDGRVKARCPCPYALNNSCRHRVVALQYLTTAAEGKAQEAQAATGEAPAAPPPPSGPALYRLEGPRTRISTRPDGTLLRVALHSLGSTKTPHRIGLQLFTGTGWTDVRTAELDRWIARGDAGPHPRDAALGALLVAEGSLRRELDSETFSTILFLLAGSEALVTRTGEPLKVSLWPYRLAARIVRGSGEGLAVAISCLPAEGDAVPFGEVSLVPSVTPWIQLEAGRFHPLLAGAPGPILAEVQEEEMGDETGEALDRLLSTGIARLERLCPGGVETEPGLIAEVEGVSGARIRLLGNPERLAGRLELSYGGEWSLAPRTPEPFTVRIDGKIHRYPPAGQALSRADRELEGLGFHREREEWVRQGPGTLAAVLRPRTRPFVELIPPEILEALNLVDRPPVLRLEVSGAGDLFTELSRRETEAGGAGGPGLLAAGSRPRSGIAWLEASYRLVDDGRELPVDLAALREARARDPHGTLQLEDGTVIGLDAPPVRSLIDLAEENEPGAAPGSLKLPFASLGELMAETPGREVELRGGARTLADALTGRGGVEPAPLRPEVEELLRPYQRDAVGWMGRLGALGLGGILADEMGLGKTVMTLAHYFGRAPDDGGGGASSAARDPVLVVCPSSLIFNWVEECRRFFPEAKAVGLYGLPPAEREEAIRRGADLLVTSYALLRRDREALEARGLRAAVLDEGQQVKNPRSQTAQAAFALSAPERWILTGTPIENHLGELWSLFRFLMPGFLGSEEEFRETFAEPIARGEDEAAARLRARGRPFILRRTKAQVLPDLPPRIDQVERVTLSPVQERLYREYLEMAKEEIGTGDPRQSRIRLLAALTRLRQICCHPRLVQEKEAGAAAPPSTGPGAGGAEAEEAGGKLELCLELLEECREEGHRVLLYSQFTSMLDIIEEALEARGIARCRLDGSTRDRETVVKTFQRDSSIPVFLISLKAGGYGLNLTGADTVILYDPWWNPAAEEQAAARAHRIGQTLPVHVHKLIAAGTVEEKILELQARKRDLAGRVVGAGEEPLAALDIDELRAVVLGS